MVARAGNPLRALHLRIPGQWWSHRHPSLRRTYEDALVLQVRTVGQSYFQLASGSVNIGNPGQRSRSSPSIPSCIAKGERASFKTRVARGESVESRTSYVVPRGSTSARPSRMSAAAAPKNRTGGARAAPCPGGGGALPGAWRSRLGTFRRRPPGAWLSATTNNRVERTNVGPRRSGGLVLFSAVRQHRRWRA